MAKDTSRHLHELSNGVSVLSQSEQKNWRLNRERLHNDFTKALNSFQAAQRTAAQKEKEVLKKAKAAAGVGGGLQGPGQRNLIDIEEGSPQEEVQRKQQMLMQEEYDMEQLQERQRQINQLEVNKISDGVRYTYTKIRVVTDHKNGDLRSDQDQ